MNDLIITEDERTCLMTGRPIRKPKEIFFLTEFHDPSGSECTAKVWRKTDSLPMENDIETILAFNKIPGGVKMHEMVDILSSLEGVTRVELQTPSGGLAVTFED